MSKEMVISFVLKTVLSSAANVAFAKMGKNMAELSRRVSDFDKNQGLMTAFQKAQETMTQTAEKLDAARASLSRIRPSKKSLRGPQCVDICR